MESKYELLTVKEISERYNVSMRLVREAFKRGDIKTKIKPSGRQGYCATAGSVERWIDRHFGV